ncbi:TetR/AcrR family transcriptional regulator [uncultured Pseudokineococcus sp.]|uniref:TetR/AcrR family transcriptional regulator n=1 Tax=uncultured Pseudokineococcus sp. TaxID=1642928 RepID=UPI002609A000|nr:TetR/AcrR family transcriptional regulator C-terminal domain-containing protein [uncultured Pseudokineococcus sp.]
MGDEAGRKAAGQSGATRRPPGLSRAAVLDAALDIVDRRGIGDLSMRKLGAALHVEAMALYRYVQSREALLDGLVDRVMDDLYADPSTLLRPEDDWRDFLQRVAAGVRRIAQQHPQLFPLVATRPPAAPWIRPPLRSLRWVEGFLSGLQERGFTEDGAIYAYRAFATFLVGHLLLEVSARGVDPVPAAASDEPAPEVDLTAYPVLSRLAPRLAVEDLDEEFAHSLGNLLDRIGENSRLARPAARG